MATVIRVKRRIDEEPLNAFVLNSKKRRFEDMLDDGALDASASHYKDSDADATSSTVVKFAGTVQNQDDIAGHIRKLTKADAIDAANHVRRPLNVAARQRNAHRQHAQEDRFKIVNCYRTLDDGALGAAEAAAAGTNSVVSSSGEGVGKLTVVDIEKNDTITTTMTTSASSASAAMTLSETPTFPTITASASSSGGQTVSVCDVPSTPQYVYDLYFPDATVPNANMDTFIEDLLSVEPLDQLMYGGVRGNDGASSSDDSEDSNNEGNYRNDYPDTEEDEGEGHDGRRDDDDDSIGDEAMRRAFDSIELDDNLSSDDEAVNGFGAIAPPTNGFVYSIDEEESAGGCTVHDSDVDEDDISRYGIAYARYKARLLRKQQRTGASDEDSDSYDDKDNEGRDRMSGSSDAEHC